MFYSPDILKRKEGFSVIWYTLFLNRLANLRLAATLGAKSSLKRLQKRDILSVDVPRACTFLSANEEPLALRLSSSLMYGVTRVFSQQYQFFYGDLHEERFNKRIADVNAFHTRIRRETMLMNATGAKTLLD